MSTRLILAGLWGFWGVMCFESRWNYWTVICAVALIYNAGVAAVREGKKK